MEKSENENLPLLTSKTEPPPIPPSPPPSSPHQTESLLSPSHQAVSPLPSPPPKTNLSLIPFLEYNPTSMTAVFPSSSDHEPIPTVFTSQAPSPSISKSKVSKPKKSKSTSLFPARRSQRMRSVNKPPKIDTNVHIIDCDGERTKPRVIETVEPQLQETVESQPKKSPPKRKIAETLVETTPPPSKQPKKSASKKRKQTVETSPSQPQKNLRLLAQALQELKQNQALIRKLKLPLWMLFLGMLTSRLII